MRFGCIQETYKSNNPSNFAQRFQILRNRGCAGVIEDIVNPFSIRESQSFCCNIGMLLVIDALDVRVELLKLFQLGVGRRGDYRGDSCGEA